MMHRCCCPTILLPVLICFGWGSLGCGSSGRPIANTQACDKTKEPWPAPRGTDAAQPNDRIFLPKEGPSETEYPALKNLIQVTEQIYSGAEPKTEAAFEQLSDLGVEVIVSVDGARPNVELARKYRMQYIHIPIGYEGIDTRAGKLFARVANEVDQTIYVHCHHGRHRGPAGAAAICMAQGKVGGSTALKILQQAGTSKNYAGLWRDVARYQRPIAEDELPELVSVAKVGSLAVAMANIDRAWDNLKLCQSADWRTPDAHPDVTPTQEALLLKEGFRETVRQLNKTQDADDPLVAWMAEAEEAATQLEAVLRDGDTLTVGSKMNRIQAQCKRCHEEYRTSGSPSGAASR